MREQMNANGAFKRKEQPGNGHKQQEIKKVKVKADGANIKGNPDFFESRKQLPIFSAQERLVSQIKAHNTVIVIGETGSGKTTQLTQFLHHANIAREGTCIACTQPRRVAAISVANRVSQEMGVTLGQEVGYTVRFDDTSSKDTRVKYMTDGMLLRQALDDPTLSRYSVVILDEAHERTLHTDVLFGIIKGIQKKRPELKVIVMSATLDADKFSGYFGGCPVLYVQGRMFPVDVWYTVEPQADFLDATFTSLLQIHQESPPGDILCFMTGQEEIETMQKMLQEVGPQLAEAGQAPIQVLPIFSALPSERQMKVFEAAREGHRKIILATNIAETSITINGIKYVVDTGLVKAKTYVARSCIDQLQAIPVSKAQARQRAGRAGRESHGTCYRLYTEETFHNLDDTTKPEILRCNLASVTLQMRAMGIDNVMTFDFMDPPSREALHDALMLLLTMGALDRQNQLTTLGKRMAIFPVDPRWAKTFLASKDHQCTDEIITIAAMLSVPSIFFIPFDKRDEVEAGTKKRFMSTYGDHMTYLNVYKGYMQHKGSAEWCRESHVNKKNMKLVTDMRKQFQQLCEQMGFPIASARDDSEKVRQCLAHSFFTNVAVLQHDKTYRTVQGSHTVSIHPGSVLKGRYPDCVLYNELVKTKRLYIRDVCAIDPAWAVTAAPLFFKGTKSIAPS